MNLSQISQIFLVSLTIKNKSSSDMTFTYIFLAYPLRLDAVKREYIYNLNHNLSAWCLGLCAPCVLIMVFAYKDVCQVAYHHYVC
jgi:hypothetical protein